jgi:uncharacterized hydrophobic protein (TIGR00271 family)
VLHLRVLCPAEHSDQVRQLLLAEPGAAHLTVLPGAAVSPPGDVFEASLTRECADRLLCELTDLGLRHTGGISLETLDTMLSDAAEDAERAVPGDPADAVIWEELIARTGEDSRLTLSFLAFLTISCLLAAIGAITDSSVTLVGAMVLGPEFGPLAAFAVGVARRRRDLVRQAGIALGVGFPVAMAIAFVASLVFRATGLLGGETLRQLNEVDFIYQVGPFSFIIAVLAGAAGMLALTSAKSSSLVGVFISVTTLPAAAFATVAAVVGEWDRLLFSVIQLVVNLVGVVLAASVVLWLSPATRRPIAVGRRPSGE